MGIAAAPDGSLYISDWVDKSYELHGKGRIWRLRNPTEKRRQWPSLVSGLSALNLQTLTGAGKVTGDLVAHCIKNDSATAASCRTHLPTDHVDLKTIATSDTSPLVRADAMRRLADPAAKEVLLKGLESEDPFIQQAARHGLQQSFKIDQLITLATAKDLTAAVAWDYS